MAAKNDGFLPFRGISAWFSCSVHPSTVKLWEKNGGSLSGESEANYLFSDESFTKDTTRLYDDPQEQIVVVKSSWIEEVLQRQCSVHDVVLGKHLLTPHFMIGLYPPPSRRLLETPAMPSTSKTTMTLSDEARIAHAQYNLVWDKLEEEVASESLDSITHINLLEQAGRKMPFDFVVSQPEFRVYKKN